MFQTEKLQKLLSARSLTLHRVSRLSAEIFGRRSPFFVPHNLYAQLSAGSCAPSVYQVLALSHITRYRVTDWLAAFGINLETISRLQLLCPPRRTTLLDATVYDPEAWVWTFRERRQAAAPAAAPFAFLFERDRRVRAREILAGNRRGFFYARVGDDDEGARAEFPPGTIIRADAERREAWRQEKENRAAGPFFLVEHELGWSCSRMVRTGGNRVRLFLPGHPQGQTEVQVGQDARVLGRVDAELRPVAGRRTVPFAQAKGSRERPRSFPQEGSGLEGLLQASRRKTGWSFREAAAASRVIAKVLSDARYFVAASTLSDYETRSAAPRQLQKIITLCALYAIPFWRFLQASGLPMDRAGCEPAPEELVGQNTNGEGGERSFAGPMKDGGARRGFMGEWRELPLFLRHSLDLITGLQPFSSADLFWVGGVPAPAHSLLSRASFVAVNRRKRKPTQESSEQQALYVVLKRDGEFLCGCCALERGSLVVDCGETARRFRDQVDAEIVGRVTAVLRRLP